MQCDDLDKSTTVDKVDFGSHEVLIKSDIEFSDTGLIITNKEVAYVSYQIKTR